MAYLAVFDTNVLVSALLSKNANASTVRVVESLFSGHLIPVFNDEILAEYEEVLHRSKFRFPEAIVHNLIQALIQNGISTERVKTDEAVLDTKDVIFYEVVLAKCQEDAYLITGNGKHFPRRPFIVTPNEMLEILEADREREVP